MDKPPVLPPDGPPPADARGSSEQIAEQPAALGIHVLPLGVGLALVGLGTGFLALRLRRG
ncbi:hypothetical protein [Streptomyces hypolithicus]